ncbi:lipopolysaccharide biosynthesis protein [Thauera propionica]|uniref:lipopolysaccharide biosynthesis protein n=1 Tax=Thauera propionica TaxID=2019431 RepID=UPI0023F3CFE7|nr:lipopolysaccharide biosynthesis protein [Thauera propionica]MDD3674119.1 lipopolysaccharide biosynthesis protein [Thauera propionica]
MPKAKPNIIHGAFLAIAMRWTDRLIGLVSTIILARILAPSDFGIIATASIVIALADVLLEMGVHVVLMQNKNPTVAHYNTAWTIRFIQTSIMTVVVLLAAPLAADYFNNPDLTLVIRILAFTFLLEGLENIWIITLQKDQQYARDFRFMFSKRFAGFLITIAWALATHSYWAMVAGTLGGRITGVVLSYAMHPNRPRFSLEMFREIFSLSQWVWVRSIAQYFQGRLHQIVVASRESSSVMGTYTLACQIAAMPTTELLAPLNRVLFPAFVKVKDDLTELKRVFLLAQGVQALVVIPAGVGMALVAHEAVFLLLGEKWLPAVPIVEVLALLGCFMSITSSGIYVLTTLGKFRITALYAAIQVSIFAVLAYLIFPTAGASEVAKLRLVLAALGLISFTAFLCRELPGLKPSEMISSIVRPVTGASVMAASILWLQQSTALSMIPLLLAKIGLGGTLYVATILTLWVASGKKQGAEMYILEKFASPLLRKFE